MLLRIGVPIHTSYNGPDGVKGSSVDVFKSAISLLPYPVGCTFVLFGDGLKNPSYSDLVQKVSENVSNISISLSLKNYCTIFIILDFINFVLLFWYHSVL